MKTSLLQLSAEEQRKADFLMQVEYIMLQIGHGHISLNEGYDLLISYIEKREMERSL